MTFVFTVFILFCAFLWCLFHLDIQPFGCLFIKKLYLIRLYLNIIVHNESKTSEVNSIQTESCFSNCYTEIRMFLPKILNLKNGFRVIDLEVIFFVFLRKFGFSDSPFYNSGILSIEW